MDGSETPIPPSDGDFSVARGAFVNRPLVPWGFDVPRAHRSQMEAYAAALKVIFPGRTVRSALLYTAGPKRIDIDA